MMAEKRHLEAGGALAYSKLPRLEADLNHPASLCRSGVLPGHASDSHYSYQGTYFSYPLPCHGPPELSVHWSPADPYVPCMDGAVSQRHRAEKEHCMLYRPELGDLGTWAQNPGYEKRKDCLVGDTLAAPEKWANYSGHSDFFQQGWFPLLHSSRVPTGCLPLVAPKPVYQNHVYCADAGCSPKGALSSGAPAESPLKWPTDAEWTLPSSGHPVNASGGSATAKKTSVAESGFSLSHLSWKDAIATPGGFLPYHKTFKSLQVVPSTSLGDSSYPAGCKNRESVPEECPRSPCGKAWSKLPPPASPLAAPQGPAYPERSSACYPLTSPEQLLLYQRSIAQVEKQKAVFALPACKSFNFPAGEDPQFLSSSCFPPASRSYYPGHLESHIYRGLGSTPVPSPGLKASREQERQQSSQPKISFEPRNPISTCSVTEKASRGRSFSSREGVRDWHGTEGTARPASESFWCQQATPQAHAFQPPHSVERLPSCVNGYRRTQEAFYGVAPCPLETSHTRGEGPLYAEKQSSLSSGDQKRDTGKGLKSGACIVIPDSPVTSHESYLKGNSVRGRISESSDSSVQHMLQSPGKEPRGLQRSAASPPPSSPPMPVIHNVFSLAPYREYLEGSAVSLPLPSSKGCPLERPSSEKSRQKAEGTTSPRPLLAELSKMPRELLDRGKDAASNVVAEGGRKDPGSSCIGTEKESGGCVGFCENAPTTSWRGATGCASEFARDDHVLDLSLKTEGLPDVHAQRPAGKTEGLERENGKRHGESVQEGPAKGQEAIQDTSSLAFQPPPQNSSEEKSNFQSSAAFWCKKFKILKIRVQAGLDSTRQQNFQSSSQTGAVSNNVCLQRDSEQAMTQQNHVPVQQSSQRVVPQQNSLPVQQGGQQVVTQHDSLPVQQSSQQVVTQQNSLLVQQSSQQVVTQQNSLPFHQTGQQVVAWQNSLPAQQRCQQGVTRQNSLPVQQNSLPVQQMVTRRNSLPATHITHEKSPKPSTQRLSRKCLKQPDISKLPPPAAPAGSPTLGEVSASLPAGCKSPALRASPKRYFTALHTSVCTIISDSVSTSSPELLREWLEKTEPEREPEPKAASSAKAKSRPKTPEAPKPSKGKRVWLDFKDAAGLLSQLRLQLETFVFTRECPFPHVVRAGTIFLPIHVLKEQLFGNLPGASVDHVLQAHKVELRPTTLSEEKLLRELGLKSCTSRMLKLLALKQLPDIYTDLLDLHWRHCVEQQLGEPAEEIQSGDLDSAGASRCLQSATHVLSPGAKGKHKQGRKCESTPQGEAPGSPPETCPPIYTPKSQGPPSFSKRNAAPMPTKGLLLEDATSVIVGTKPFLLRSGAKRQLFRTRRLSRMLQLRLASRVTRSTSKVLPLRKPIVRIRFQNAVREKQGRPVLTGKKEKRPPSLLLRSFRRQRTGARHTPRHRRYPELVGKRIRHLYEEKDKTEAWYRGVVLRVHKPHKDPLKTVYEVKYDNEPEWQYYLEILQDYKKGWLEVDE